MFDIGIGEFLLLAVLALLVFGPDRLPRVVAQASAMLRQLREQANTARQEITAAVDLDSTGLKDLADLHPRRIARSVLEPIDDARREVTDAARPAVAPPSLPSPAAAPPSSSADPAAGPPPAFDPDAT